MNLDSLRVFCDVAAAGSFSRGADMHGISQPAASQSVRHLEEELGVDLIDRRRRPFVLTPEGAAFVAACRPVLDKLDLAIGELQAARGLVAGTVRVAAIYSIGLEWMTRCVQRFAADNPHARVQVEYMRPSRVEEAVASNTADMGLLSFPQEGRQFRVEPLRTERMVCVCAPEHRLARREVLTSADLDGEALVSYDDDLRMRKALDRFLRSHHVHPHTVMTFDNVDTIKHAVRLGTGVAVLPEPTVASDVETGRLIARPLHFGEFIRPLGIIYRKSTRFPPAADRFRRVLTTTA